MIRQTTVPVPPLKAEQISCCLQCPIETTLGQDTHPHIASDSEREGEGGCGERVSGWMGETETKVSLHPKNMNNCSTYIYFRIGKVVEQSPPTPKRKPLLGPSVPPWPPASRDVGHPKTR